MTIEIYLLYLATLAVFFLGPPDSTELLTISNSMKYGLQRTLACICGDLSANVLQMTVAAFGLASVIAVSAFAVTTIKWFGVAYLAFLGLRMLLGSAAAEHEDATKTGAPRALFSQGFLTALANPWAIIFFAALFPQFIDTNAPVLPQLLILGVTYIFVDGTQLLAYGAAASAAKARLRWLQGPLVSRISGGLMLAAAVLLANKDFTQAKGVPQ